MATHSSIHAWRIPWTEEPGGLRSIGLQGVRHNLPSTQDSHCFHFTSARSWADMWGYFYAQRDTPAVGFFFFYPQFSSVAQSCLTLCDPMDAARQVSLSIINSQSLLKLMSIESVMPSNHLILCRPLLLLPSVFPNIRVFPSESALHIRWPKY